MSHDDYRIMVRMQEIARGKEVAARHKANGENVPHEAPQPFIPPEEKARIDRSVAIYKWIVEGKVRFDYCYDERNKVRAIIYKVGEHCFEDDINVEPTEQTFARIVMAIEGGQADTAVAEKITRGDKITKVNRICNPTNPKEWVDIATVEAVHI